jgi:hypothetical protein
MARSKLESAISRDVKKELQSLGWHVEVITCNAFMRGIPDFYCYQCVSTAPDGELHRWVDIKRPKGGTLTKYQAQKWPLWESIGLGVWILTGTGQENILHGPPNFRDWWKPRYDKYALTSPADILRNTK